MKKIAEKLAALMLAAALGLSMAACSSADNNAADEKTEEKQEDSQKTSGDSKTDDEEDADAADKTEKATGSTEEGQKYEAVITVKDYGTITFTMTEGTAPETVQNFVSLAQSGFYDGLTFHRIIEGFMIQGGDPKGNGTGGSSKTITGEFSSNGFDNTLKHVRGTVSMARSTDPDSASSQFFIMQEDTSSLDGEYAAFGTVTDGMDVVDAIAAAAVTEDSNGTVAAENQPVIESITVTEID